MASLSPRSYLPALGPVWRMHGGRSDAAVHESAETLPAGSPERVAHFRSQRLACNAHRSALKRTRAAAWDGSLRRFRRVPVDSRQLRIGRGPAVASGVHGWK